MLASSSGLSVAFRKGVSVTPKVPATGAIWIVVPNANRPGANGNAADPAVAALFVQLMPVYVGPAPVLTNFTTTEFGFTPVSVLLITSSFTDKETNPLGVIRQEQQEINCSSGENPYTFTHMFPIAAAKPGPVSEAPLAPLLVKLITESPEVKLAA